MEFREAEPIPTALVVSGILATVDIVVDEVSRSCLTLQASNGCMYELGMIVTTLNWDGDPLRLGHILERQEMNGVLMQSSRVMILEFPMTAQGLTELSAYVYCCETPFQTPYIPQVHTPIVSNDRYYLVVSNPVMELPLFDLFEYVSHSPMFPLWNTESIFMQILIGLDSLHRRGIFHRVICLESIILPTHHHDGDVQCVLFGYSRAARMVMYDIAEQDEGNTRVYRQPVVPHGKSQYMAPELWTHTYPNLVVNGVKADLWSLGITLFILLTGKSKAFLLKSIFLLV